MPYDVEILNRQALYAVDLQPLPAVLETDDEIIGICASSYAFTR